MRTVSASWNGRAEDEPLLRGLGRFGDDIRPEQALFASFVRSSHAFAEINGIDVTAALKAPGVRAVYTGADFADANLDSVTRGVPIPGRAGTGTFSPVRPALAGARVHHVGEPVALVLADTRDAAEDAGGLVEIDYRPLTPVTDGRRAIAPDAPQLFPDAPGNIAIDWVAPADDDGSRKAEIDRIFASATHVARVELMNQRLIVAAMEPRTATASYDPASDLYTLRCGSQGVAQVRNQVMGSLRVKPDKLRVLTDDVGGGFGMKASSYPEYVALLCAARKVGRPVHWTASRAESFLSDNQGRDSYWKVELALDRHGRFLALRVDGTANVGAFVTSVAHFCSTTHISGCLPSVYDIPKMYIHTRCVLTNTLPIGAYRGAGRPEANYLLERVIDEAARMTGLDRAEIRRRNLIPPDRVPYHTAFGGTYDSGEFPAMFEKAIKLADYQGFAARRERSEKAGKLRGIGVACFLEIAGAYPEEAATIAFPGGSRVDIGMGAGPSGQGHITVFRRLAAERLGIPESAITILHGDSLRDPPGFGVVASRSAAMVGGAIVTVVDEMLAKARATAALLLQANEEAVEYDAGAFHVPGSGRAVSIFEVAEHAKDLVRQGVIPETLDTKGVLKAPSTYPNGCHVAEVEIDPDTGALTVESYVSVDDCGRVLDPVIVAGQMHGGIAQGLGQALLEDAVYDPNGQLLSASFMDYALPRADVMPAKFMTEHHEVACRTNPLGVKGTGEAGTTAAPCVLMNAVADALPPEAAIGMPATPQKIWQALRDARRR